MPADLPVGFEIIVAAVFGALIGSFLNVCILRWGADPKQSVVTPRSRCPRCGSGLAWYDNIPVVSWIVLRARCRRCGEPISAQYPLVELATAGIWAFMVWRSGLTLEALRGALFGTILLGIAMTDAREYIIPHEFSIGGTLLAIVLSAWPEPASALVSIQGALLGAGAVLLIGELSGLALGQEAMGGGDCALMGMIGAFLGWEAVFPVILVGAVVSTLLFILAAVWPRRATEYMSPPDLAGTEPGVPQEPARFRWGLVGKLFAAGALPVVLLTLSISVGMTDTVLTAMFHALIGAGIAYYLSFLLPARVAEQWWVRVAGLIAAALAVALGSGLSIGRIATGVVLAGAVLWLARRASPISTPETAEGLQAQGYLPFGVGLAIAAAVIEFSGATPVVRDVVLEYGRMLRLA